MDRGVWCVIVQKVAELNMTEHTDTHTLIQFLSFPHSAVVKNLWPLQEMPDTGSISASGRSPGVGNRTYSSMLAWKVPQAEEPGGLHGVTKSQT